jgi:TPR repeat protein
MPIEVFKKDELLMLAEQGNINAIQKLVEYYSLTNQNNKLELTLKKGIEYEESYEFSIQLGNYFCSQEKYDLAEECFMKGANNNDIPSIYQLAVLEKHKNDTDKMFKYLNVCIENNYSHAINLMGHYYLEQKNYRDATKYYQMGADLGYKECMNSLAVYYSMTGETELMMKYLNKSIEQGYTRSMINLGTHYQDNGDYDNMKKYFEMAAEQGCLEAIKKLVNYYRNINDEENMVKYLELAIEFYDMDCIIFLGNHYKKKYDYENSIKLFELAIGLGNPYGYSAIGSIYFTRIKDYDKMKEYFNKAIEAGEPNGMLYFGAYYKSILDFKNMFKYYSMYYKTGFDGIRVLPEIKNHARVNITGDILTKTKEQADSDDLASCLMISLHYLYNKDANEADYYFKKCKKLLNTQIEKYELIVYFVTQYFISLNNFLKSNNLTTENFSDREYKMISSKCCDSVLELNIIYDNICTGCDTKFNPFNMDF